MTSELSVTSGARQATLPRTPTASPTWVRPFSFRSYQTWCLVVALDCCVPRKMCVSWVYVTLWQRCCEQRCSNPAEMVGPFAACGYRPSHYAFDGHLKHEADLSFGVQFGPSDSSLVRCGCFFFFLCTGTAVNVVNMQCMTWCNQSAPTQILFSIILRLLLGFMGMCFGRSRHYVCVWSETRFM